ncbi:MAG: 2-keto-4-pentenoate hydratase [Betaproteobacteria bacterium]|nr:MAG: 2-keto-4-pentenoate hydratase [Betaproteobacteria bacterium]
MAALTPALARVADRLDAAFVGGRQVPRFGDGVPGFDVAGAYAVLDELHARRVARGWRPVGRKIGFTNTTIWARYGVDRPMWSHVWDRTVADAADGRADVPLDGLMEPRLEPEIVFGIARALPAGDDPAAVLASVAWIAPGCEIVHSAFPAWKFSAAECTAAYGLHGRLVVGPRRAVDEGNRSRIAAALPGMAVTLRRGGALVDEGVGANVLGSPVRALMFLRDVLAAQPWAPPLAPGEIVTTGTLTDAQPVRPGETWQATFDALGLPALTLAMR